VLDYYLKPENQWTKDGSSAFTKALVDDEITVVLHRWKPAEPILEAIEAAGARLIVLDAMDTSGKSEVGYLERMEANLTALHDALSGNEAVENRMLREQ
jgi:ABC-type Zn uptake system ZnuABC Zn-binding protein ZnuA